MAAGFSSEKESRALSLSQWIVPSIADLIFVMLLALLCFTSLSVRLLGDAGIGWHIRTGQIILATRSIPRFDFFSSSLSGQPWFAWEWLYDVVVGWLDRAAGLNAVVFFTAVIISLTFSFAFLQLQRRGTNLIIAVGLVLLAASASMIHFFARPHVLSWLFSLIWFGILDFVEEDQNRIVPSAQIIPRRQLLWLLPPLMLLWVNLHGGFLLGFALLGIYFLSAVWTWIHLKEGRFEAALQKIRTGKRARNLAWIGLLSWLATFVNPYGWNLHLHIYRYLSNRFLMDHIDEFQSPNFHGVAQKCFAILILLTFVALAAGKRSGEKLRLSHALLLLFAVYSGLYAARDIPVSSLLLVLIIGPYLSSALPVLTERTARAEFAPQSSRLKSPAFLSRMQSIDSSLRGHLWPAAATLLTGWIALHGGQLGATKRMNTNFDAKRFPAAAADYLQQQSRQVPIFAPDAWGGYLIYRLYPQTKVVLDDRHDFYGDQFLKAYLSTIHVEPGWQDFLLAHGVQCILIPKDSALANLLLETPPWRPVYSDDVATIFLRSQIATQKPAPASSRAVPRKPQKSSH
jgi:hypothetical protein